MNDSDKHQNPRPDERSQESLSVANKEFVERVRAMSSRERVSFLVSAGINEPDGTLTERYRD